LYKNPFFMGSSNSQFNSWRAFIAGKRIAWQREESPLKAIETLNSAA
jgi:hypothetical protein